MEAGIDSLGMVELQNLLETNLSIKLPTNFPFDYPTSASMAAYIFQKLNTQLEPLRMSQSNANRAQYVADELSLLVKAKLGEDVGLDQVRTLIYIAFVFIMVHCMVLHVACP